MSWLRKKAARAASKGAAEPTDSPLFGATMDGDVLREIDATGPTSWMRARPEREGLEVTEENFPEAWAAGRELAKGAYARRLRDAQPIPRRPEAAKVAGTEAIALMSWIPIVLRGHIQRDEVSADDLDTRGALAACVQGYAATALHLFNDHWQDR
jgi:hypothetical protein